MPKYVVLFSLKDEALARFIENPEDRRGGEQTGGSGGREAGVLLLDVRPI